MHSEGRFQYCSLPMIVNAPEVITLPVADYIRIYLYLISNLKNGYGLQIVYNQYSLL